MTASNGEGTLWTRASSRGAEGAVVHHCAELLESRLRHLCQHPQRRIHAVTSSHLLRRRFYAQGPARAERARERAPAPFCLQSVSCGSTFRKVCFLSLRPHHTKLFVTAAYKPPSVAAGYGPAPPPALTVCLCDSPRWSRVFSGGGSGRGSHTLRSSGTGRNYYESQWGTEDGHYSLRLR